MIRLDDLPVNHEATITGKKMKELKIAVVGSGIAGLSAAWLLSKRHKVTLYEAGDYLGGHANTVDLFIDDDEISVDTGFIVFNELNYPNLTALFSCLDVATEQTEMTFSLSQNRGEYEYSGSGLTGFFGQPANIAKLKHWLLLKDVSRFFRTCLRHIEKYPETISLGEFLKREGYSASFINDHILPMGAAIWSTAMTYMLAFPARSFVEFYDNHGMLQVAGRPLWRTVSGGSRTYIEKLRHDADFEIQLQNGIRRIKRQDNFVQLLDNRGAERPFDHVVIATHADQALKLLGDPTPSEKRLLGSVAYQENETILHRDTRFMPRRKSIWSSWNYLKNGEGVDTSLCVTYWLNRLQKINTATNLFVTLNPNDEIHPKAIEATFRYHHPVFSADTIAARKNLWSLQGKQRTWFCGSYFGYGFHEDGIQSGLAVAEQLGGVRRPWDVEKESDRIFLTHPIQAEAAE